MAACGAQLTVNRETLAVGVGLSSLMLCRFAVTGSTGRCFLPSVFVMLAGMLFLAVPLAFPAVRETGLGVGFSNIVATDGLTNMPWPAGQSKYR